MKKILALILAMALALGLFCACGKDEETKDDSSAESKEEQVSSGEETSDDSSEDSSADSSEETSQEASGDSSEESVDDRVKENPAEFVGTWYGNSYNSVGETLTLNADGTGVSDYTYAESEHFDWYVIDGEFYYYFYETDEDEAVEVATEQTAIDAENGTFSHVIITFYEALYSYSTTKPEFGGDESLLGTWATDDTAYIFSFYDDGSGDLETEDDIYYFVWTADTENAYLVTTFDFGDEESYTYSASADGVSLITNGDVLNLSPYEYSYEEEPIIDPDQPLGGDDSLVGTWTMEEYSMDFTFNADGTGNYTVDGEAADIVWFVEASTISVVLSYEGFEMLVLNGEYAIDGENLSITADGYTEVLTKKA